MRARFLKAIVVLSLAVILLGMPLLTPHRIRTSAFLLIEPGMTELELEQLLGAKAGHYDGYGQSAFFSEPDEKGPGVYSKTWASRSGSVEVWFDRHDRVKTRLIRGSVPITWWTRIVDRILPAPSPSPKLWPPFGGLTTAT